MTEQTPAAPPAVWWSPTEKRFFAELWGAILAGVWREAGTTLPADAVRLVPDERAVSDREAVLERERLVRQKTLEHYERKIERLQAHAAELGRTLDRTAVALSESQRALRKATKAAQSGDTDRLAWISEAGETAAGERQARYQETACARRPAEEHPDA